MKKLIYLIVVILALGLIVAGCFSVVPPVEQDGPVTLPSKAIGDSGEVWNQTSGIQYFTIQAAIDEAEDGDTIEVAAGIYNETPPSGPYHLSIDKPLTLKGAGADATIIDAWEKPRVSTSKKGYPA